MNDSDYNELRAESWRRKLTPAEEMQAQAYWATHPGAQAEWEADLAITRQLHELPDVPLASNFTSLVLQAVEAEAPTAQRTLIGWNFGWWWPQWLSRLAPRMALGMLVMGLGVGLFVRHEGQHRKKLVEDVRDFMYVAALPGPEVFEDFDAIQRLPISVSSTDDDLVAALQ